MKLLQIFMYLLIAQTLAYICTRAFLDLLLHRSYSSVLPMVLK